MNKKAAKYFVSLQKVNKNTAQARKTRSYLLLKTGFKLQSRNYINHITLDQKFS